MPSDRRHIYHEMGLFLSIRIDKKTADHVSRNLAYGQFTRRFSRDERVPIGVHS